MLSVVICNSSFMNYCPIIKKNIYVKLFSILLMWFAINTICRANVVLLLGQRRRRWANIFKAALAQRLVAMFSGVFLSVTRYSDPMLFECWAPICDAGPTFKQLWVNGYLFTGFCFLKCLKWRIIIYYKYFFNWRIIIYYKYLKWRIIIYYIKGYNYEEAYVWMLGNLLLV